MNNPAWLENLKYAIRGNHQVPLSEEIENLRLYVPFVERWIDKNRVFGSPEASGIVSDIVGVYCRIADWSLLSHSHAASDLRKLVIRLKGLLT